MSVEALFQSGILLHQQGKLDEAETVYRQLLEISPEHTEVLHLLGMIAVQRGAYDSGIKLLYKAHKLDPKAVSYEFTLAHALQESGRPKEALEHYKSVLEKDDSIPDTYGNMGIIYRMLGEYDEARKSFETSIKKKPDFSLAYVNFALMERDLGHSDKAEKLLAKAIESDNQEPEAYAQMAVTLRNTGRYEDALPFHEKALELSRHNPIYWNGIGITYERLDKLDEAFEAYNTAIELNPLFPDPYNNRANIYVKRGKHWDAEDDYKHAVKLDPQYASAFNNLGALLYDHERYEEALECYRKAFIINPKQAETCSNLAMAVKEAGDPGEAVGLYFNALALNPSLTKIHHYLAQALYAFYEQDSDMATKLSKKWLEFFPDNPVAKHVVTAFEGKTPEKASPDYVKELFDSFADSFEATLQKINYRVPELIKQELKEKENSLKILDAGCGTGLIAPILKPHALVLDGVDLSEKMIETATEKKIYDHLKAQDAIPYMNEHPSGYDLIVLADVACYFGDLSELLQGTYNSLSEKGEILFTVEFSDKGAFKLQPSGRFAHSEKAIKEWLGKAGFENISIRNEVLRTEKEKDVQGLFVSAVKRPTDKNYD